MGESRTPLQEQGWSIGCPSLHLFFWIELSPFNHSCHWVVRGHKKNFSIIDSKLKFGERFSFLHFLQGKNAQNRPENQLNKIEIWLKWPFEWPNQNSKTTFIVQTFPKYGPYGFDLVNLSLLGQILAKFQFCWFSGLFWAFFPSKKCKNENLSPHFNFWSITLKFFLWTHTTQEHEWLIGCSSIKKKVKNGTPYLQYIA